MNGKKLFHNEDGAASVIVILMLVALVAFGAVAIASARVNLKFSQNSIGWDEEYYKLDGSGEEYLYHIDSALIQAGEFAAEYLRDEGYKKDFYDGVTNEIQELVHSLYRDHQQDSDLYDRIFRTVYMEKAYDNMGALSQYYPDNQNLAFEKEGIIRNIETEMNIQSATRNNYNLKIRLNINPDYYDILYEANAISIIAGEDKRYSILEWSQWQPEHKYNQTQELWDGSISGH